MRGLALNRRRTRAYARVVMAAPRILSVITFWMENYWVDFWSDGELLRLLKVFAAETLVPFPESKIEVDTLLLALQRKPHMGMPGGAGGTATVAVVVPDGAADSRPRPVLTNTTGKVIKKGESASESARTTGAGMGTIRLVKPRSDDRQRTMSQNLLTLTSADRAALAAVRPAREMSAGGVGKWREAGLDGGHERRDGVLAYVGTALTAPWWGTRWMRVGVEGCRARCRRACRPCI